MNSIVSALRFFFTHTIDRPDLTRKLIRVAHPRNLPVVLSRDEVARLLNATTCLKHQAALSVAYGAGLRVAEVTARKVADIDSERMLIRVERGKGGRYRNAMLPADLLILLREWWKVGHQQGVMHRDGWLFPGQHAMKPISTRQLHCIVVDAAQAAEITKRVGPTHAAPQLCHPSAGRRRRHPRLVDAERHDLLAVRAIPAIVLVAEGDAGIRRFLLHVLPRGFHRIRHYGLLASSARKASLTRVRELLAIAPPPDEDVPEEPIDARPPCPCCGGHMIIIETFERWRQPRAPPHCIPPTGRNSP